MILISSGTFRYLVWNKLYRRTAIETLRFLSGKIHEDVFYVYQAFGLCKKIVKLHSSLYLYRQWPESIMGTAFSLKRLDSLEARKAQIEYVKAHFPALLPEASLQYLGSCLYYAQMALRCKEKTLAKKHQEHQKTHPRFSQHRWDEWPSASPKEWEDMRNKLQETYGYF